MNMADIKRTDIDTLEAYINWCPNDGMPICEVLIIGTPHTVSKNKRGKVRLSASHIMPAFFDNAEELTYLFKVHSCSWKPFNDQSFKHFCEVQS